MILQIRYTSSGFESYNKENIIFITFGGPTKEYHDAVSRITKEAKDMGVFNSILGFTDKDLKEDFSFWNKHGQFIENNKRGYGYWIWKPYLTKKTIEKINKNDIIVYADAGCVLNKKGRSRLLEYINMAKNSDSGIISFELGHYEKEWTKMDIFHELNALDQIETKQLVGGVFIIKKTPNNETLVNDWYEKCSIYELLNDSESQIQNHVTFKENRHDQSIWSILRKKNNTLILKDETYFIDFEKEGEAYPILAMRKRNG